MNVRSRLSTKGSTAARATTTAAPNPRGTPHVIAAAEPGLTSSRGRSRCLVLRRSAVMKVTIFAIFAAFATATAFSLSQLILPNQVIHGKPKAQAEIPGNSPLETCMDDEPQLAQIDEAYIDPNPPLPGENLTVSAKGTLKKDITDGSYVDVLVRYGFITLVNRRYDLCELLPEVDLECPVPAGFLSLSRSVELPDNIPPGEYSVEVKAYTVEDELLSCLSGVVEMDS